MGGSKIMLHWLNQDIEQIKSGVIPPGEPTVMPEFIMKLDWPGYDRGGVNHPTPMKRITHRQYMLKGSLSGVSEIYRYYASWILDQGQPAWDCIINIYSTHAIVEAHTFRHSKGAAPENYDDFIPRYRDHGDNEVGYYVRFYQLGCQHKWKLTYARMCYREYICALCNQTKAEDSSD